MNKDTFNLLSGPECKIKELTTKHQRWLTEQNTNSSGTKMNMIIADLLVSVGNYRGPFDENYAKALLAADRKLILVKARELSLGDEYTEEERAAPGFVDKSRLFEFTWDYVDAQGRKQSVVKEVELDADGSFPTKPYRQQVENYTDIKKDVEVTLRSGRRVVYSLLDGFGEEIGATIKKQDRSSNTPLIMRNVREYVPNREGDKQILVVANLDKWPLRDTEDLRKHIKEEEGRVDTEEMFEHPEAELKPRSEKFVTIDLIGISAFFFPSQSI